LVALALVLPCLRYRRRFVVALVFVSLGALAGCEPNQSTTTPDIHADVLTIQATSDHTIHSIQILVNTSSASQ
jgi:hypothetical protein